MESLEQKIARVVAEHVAIVPYDPEWPRIFEQERDHLLSCLPNDLIERIEHFGSTAVPGLAAKPIVDMLVQVADLEQTKTRIAPLLEAQGYDYFWRPSFGDDTPPFYAWFIKRDASGVRTHHIHMVEAHFAHWDRLLFRDYLIEHPAVAAEYAELKMRLSERHGGDRVAYTKAKSDFVTAVTARAKAHSLISIRIAGAAEFPRIRTFYAETDYAGGVHPSDAIVLAEFSSELVGVYRLAREAGVLVLRGMRVHPSARRQGIGTRLLGHLRDVTERCYCIPHAHLESFYGQAGFARLRIEAAPAFLAERAAEYRTQGLDVLIMVREPGARFGAVR